MHKTNRPKHLRHSPESNTEKRKISAESVKKISRIVAVTAIAGGALGLSASENPSRTLDEMTSLTPTPAVNTQGSEIMIQANDALRDFGPWGLGIGASAGIAYAAGRRFRPNSKLAAMHDIAHQTPRTNRILFAGATMGIIAGAAGIGNAASQGAGEAITITADMFGADKAATPVITDYAGAPGNYMSVDVDGVSRVIQEEGGIPVAYSHDLGEIKNPSTEINPSSAPIITVPSAILERSFNVSMPAVEDCNDISVIVGEQLGVSKGEKVLVNDRIATVAGTVAVKPGLDRVAVIGSTEQFIDSKCIFPNKPLTGIAALGLEGKQEELLQKINERLNLTYSARTFNELEEENEKFWDRSVKPLQMMLIMDVMALGGIALGYMQATDILARRKEIAMLVSQGVRKKDIKRANNLATQMDNLKAFGVSVPVASGLAYMTNSSQFGVAQEVDPKVASGYLVVAGTTMLSSVISNRLIKKTNVPSELRGSI